MAKNVGKVFEEDFSRSCPEETLLIRLKDTQWGKNPCDFIAYQYPYMYMLELKTVKGKSLPFKNVADHQLDALDFVWKHLGVKGYFLINFRTVGETYAVSGEDMKRFKMDSDTRASYPIDWVRDTGILLPQRKARTRQRYEYAFIEEV